MTITFDQAVVAKKKVAKELFGKYASGFITSIGIAQDRGDWVILVGLAPNAPSSIQVPPQMDGVRLAVMRQGHAVAATG